MKTYENSKNKTDQMMNIFEQQTSKKKKKKIKKMHGILQNLQILFTHTNRNNKQQKKKHF